MAHAAADLAGQQFGRLIAQSRIFTGKPGTHWLCLCACGKTKVVAAQDLKRGGNTRCGECQRKERDGTGQKTCSKCKGQFPTESFARRGSGDLTCECNFCLNTRRRAAHAANPEKERDRNRARRKWQSEAEKRYQARKNEKRAAATAGARAEKAAARAAKAEAKAKANAEAKELRAAKSEWQNSELGKAERRAKQRAWRERNKDHFRQLQKEWKKSEAGKACKRRKQAKGRLVLSDDYIKRLVVKHQPHLSQSAVTQALIDAKRAHLKVQRFIQEKRK